MDSVQFKGHGPRAEWQLWREPANCFRVPGYQGQGGRLRHSCGRRSQRWRPARAHRGQWRYDLHPARREISGKDLVMGTTIFVSGICAAGFLAQALVGEPPADTRAKTEAHRIVMQRGASYLGIAVVEIDSDRAKALHLKEERGVEVTCLDPGSPAEKAGLKPGDVVLEYNGEH